MSLPEQFMNAEFERTFNKLADKQLAFDATIDKRLETMQCKLDGLQKYLDKVEFNCIKLKESAIHDINESTHEFNNVALKLNALLENISVIDAVKLRKITQICQILDSKEDSGEW